MAENSITVEFHELTPAERAENLARQARHMRNWDWLEAHASEVYSHRDRFICIAGQELFVGDSVEDVLARAKAAHPEDDGRLLRYIPKERLVRIYAHRRNVALV